MEWKLPSTPTLAPYTTKKIQKAAQAESAAAASSPSDADADADGESIPSEEGQLFRAAEEASVREMVVSTAQHSRAAQPGRGGGGSRRRPILIATSFAPIDAFPPPP